MASINVDLDFPSHPKTVVLGRLLGRDPESLLIRLWCYAGKYHAETGTILGPAADALEASIGWRGRAGYGIKALVQAQFLDVIEGGFQVHNWIRHNGHIHAGREKGRSMAQARWSKIRDPPNGKPKRIDNLFDACSNADSIADSIATSNANAMQGKAMQGEDENLSPLSSCVELARLFASVQSPRCTCIRCCDKNLIASFTSILATGMKPKTIADEILRSNRATSEQIFKLTDRLEKMAAKGGTEDMESTEQRAERIRRETVERRAADEKAEKEKTEATFSELRQRRYPGKEEENGDESKTQRG